MPLGTHSASTRAKKAPTPPTPAQQSHRACQLIHQGKLSAARQARAARPLAPRTRDRLDELRDPARRPASQYQPIDQDLLDFTPPTALQIPATTIIRNFWPAKGPRRGRPVSLQRCCGSYWMTKTAQTHLSKLHSSSQQPTSHHPQQLPSGWDAPCTAKAKRSGPGNRHRRHPSQSRVAQHRPALRFPNPPSLFPTPVCFVHPGRDRSHCARHHRRDPDRSPPDSPLGRWHWGIRHHLQKQYAARPPRRA